MNYCEAVEYIDSLGMFSRPATLERMENAVKKYQLDNDFPIIHIAGTNGKGSVAAMVSKSLEHAGYKTGLFISPHILDFCERISINGQYINHDELANITDKFKNDPVDLTEFELITLIALEYFKRHRIDVAVIETGLGGRLDATNVMSSKLISAITKIGLDHTKILGDTAEKIAAEKCGIIKGGKAVSSPYQKDGINDIIRGYSSCLTVPQTDELTVIKSDFFENEFIYKGKSYKTGMSGEHQIENALVSIETLKNCGLNICYEDIKYGVLNGFMPARMQIVSRSPLTVVDGAHNPDGAATLEHHLKKMPPVTAIVGVMRDKNYEDLLKTTLKYAKRVICVKACDYGRALPAEELLISAEKYCDTALSAATLQEAYKTACKHTDPVVVFGSLYLASDFIKLF